MSKHICSSPACAHVALTRRSALRLGVGCGASLFLATGIDAAADPVPPTIQSPEAAAHPISGYSARTQRIMRTSHVVDMLCNVRNRMIVRGEENSLETAGQRVRAWLTDPSTITVSELQRYRDSGIDVFHCSTDAGQLLPGATSYDKAVFMFEGWQRILAAHPDTFLPIYGPRELRQSRDTDKIAIILGLQNGNHFRTAADVAHFYGLGQRTSQLTYNAENHLGGGAFTEVGLKPAARDIIHAMNRVGMVLDLSHSNDLTVRGAIEETRVTPIISHTNCRTLNPGFTRAMPDDIIRAVAERGGVIGVTVLRQFVTQEEPTTIDHFVRHIDHIVEIAGINHVGIGGDSDLLPFDGVDDEARRRFFAQSSQQQYRWRERLDIDGLDHPRRMYDIVEALARRGYSDRDIRKVIGGNWVRVLGHIWGTRA